ncbi:MAG TPA: FAD-dependent oxidoreductase, partial [Planctomycetaceae bacterium]|nr:FAD-dependent oxidoreductase [Planctomycetaceae bacterium]
MIGREKIGHTETVFMEIGPTGISAIDQRFDEVFSRLRKEIGPENVVTDESRLKTIATATFHHDVDVVAILTPHDKEQVVRCVKACAASELPMYPISKGKNWGLGSASPVFSGGAVVSLEKLDRVIEYDEELAFVRIQPGVTFNQLHRFLEERGSELILDVTGADGETSVV